MDSLVAMLVSQGNVYISRYTRKKGQSLPPSPIAFTQHDLRDIHRLVNSLNEASTGESETGRPTQALDLLHLAEQLVYILRKKTEGMLDNTADLTRLVNRAHCLTYNNLGCQYLNRGKYLSALEYLEKALGFAQRLRLVPRDLGATCSNITAALSQLGRHKEALEYATRTLTLLQRAEQEGHSDLSAALVNAHFTLGLEYEHMGKAAQAVTCFGQSLDLAMQKLGSSHFLTQQIQEKLPFASKSEEFSDAIVSEDQRAELKVSYRGYQTLAGATHKVIIYRRTERQEMRCVVFPRSKAYVLKIALPGSRLSVEEVLQRLEIQQGKLILGEPKKSPKMVTVSTRQGDTQYSAVISTGKSSSSDLSG